MSPILGPWLSRCRYNALPVIWSDKLPDAERFELVLNGEGVLDKETGLVWERSLNTALVNWKDAIVACYQKNLSDRMGWRLPTVVELASLVPLSSSHPFSNIGSVEYWSATSAWGETSGHAWHVNIGSGVVTTSHKHDTYRVLAVRGGQGYINY